MNTRKPTGHLFVSLCTGAACAVATVAVSVMACGAYVLWSAFGRK